MFSNIVFTISLITGNTTPMTWLAHRPVVKDHLSAPHLWGCRESNHRTTWLDSTYSWSVQGGSRPRSPSQKCVHFGPEKVKSISLWVSGLRYVKVGSSELSHVLLGGPWQGRRLTWNGQGCQGRKQTLPQWKPEPTKPQALLPFALQSW